MSSLADTAVTDPPQATVSTLDDYIIWWVLNQHQPSAAVVTSKVFGTAGAVASVSTPHQKPNAACNAPGSAEPAQAQYPSGRPRIPSYAARSGRSCTRPSSTTTRSCHGPQAAANRPPLWSTRTNRPDTNWSYSRTSFPFVRRTTALGSRLPASAPARARDTVRGNG